MKARTSTSILMHNSVLAGIVIWITTVTPGAARAVPPDHNWAAEIEQLFGQLPGGVVVEQGRMRFLLEADCPRYIAKYGTCFGNNPASPYGVYEFSDFSAPEDALRWRLAENQAVMFIGQTPPTGRYFSFQSYPFSRLGENLRLPHPSGLPCGQACCNHVCDDGWFCDQWAPDGSCFAPRHQLAGPMGLNLNYLELVTDAGNEDSFDKFTVVVTTANKAVELRIRQVLPNRLAELGVSPNIINVDPVPCAAAAGDGTCDDSDPRNLVLGSDPTSDDFIMALRASITQSLSARNAYIEAPPATVLRVTFPGLAGVYLPYPWAEAPASPDPRLYNEIPYRDALQWLANTMQDIYAPEGAILPFELGGEDYYACIREERACYAGSEDAYYSKSPGVPRACVGSDRPVYVVGVNHSRVGPYSYSSLSLTDPDARHEVAYMEDIPYVVLNNPGEPPPTGAEVPPYMEDSVEFYLPLSQHPRPDALEGKLTKLYVAEVSPSCDPATNPHCVTLSSSELVVANLGFQERIYLNTIVGTGAGPGNFILGRVIVSKACMACINHDPSADADGDGVCDISDVCPGFDDRLDADGDGVPNGCDLCPNTIPGATVDANGCPSLPNRADLDNDGDVDMDDFSMFQACVSVEVPLSPGCRRADLDANSMVDQADLGTFQRCLSGPNVRPVPNCAD